MPPTHHTQPRIALLFRAVHAASHTLPSGAIPLAIACALITSTTAPLIYAQTPTRPAAPAAAPASPAAPSAAPSAGNARVGAAALEGLPILRVEIVGNTRTDSRLILDQIREQAGQPYSQAQVDVDTHSIGALDRFVTVSAEIVPVENPQTHLIRGVIIRYKVQERPVIATVEISGNRQFTDAQIRDALVASAGGSLDPFSLETDRKTILDMYLKKGFAQASVEIDQKALQQGIVRYRITEGPRSVITSIRFDGNHNINSDYLKFIIQTKAHFWFFRKGIFDDAKVEQDLATIRNTYRKRGFLDARDSYALDYSPDKSSLTLRFAIVEGPRYKIGHINVSGNKVFSTPELLGNLKYFGPGSYAQQDQIDAFIKRIQDIYGHQGYIEANVDASTAYTDTPGIVDLNITITEGSPYLVGRVIVRGNENIQDRVVRRQVRIYPDQTFDMVLVQKSIDRLKATGIFRNVKITPVTPSDNAAGVRDALVETDEGQTGRFSVGAGVSTDSGLFGDVSLEQQNFDITNPPHSLGEFLRGQAFKGAGQYFQILLEPGTEFQRYSVTFREPYLFDSPYSLSNSAYYFTRERESWDETRVGDTATFGRRFGDVWSASLSFRAEQVSITNFQDANNNFISDSNYTMIDPNTGESVVHNDTAQEIIDNRGDHFITSIKPAVIRDTTDSRIFPTTGTRTAFAWEQYGAMGGDASFSKLIFQFDYYTPLAEDIFQRKTVLKLANQVGIVPLGDSPFYERFYGGGIGSLRGFKFRGVGPHAGPLDDPIGGDFSWVSTAEVNYPIYENLLRGVVFADVGTVERDVTVDNIRSDVGVGMRIVIPFFGNVPLALDFAIPTSKASGDRTQIVSFSLSGAF